MKKRIKPITTVTAIAAVAVVVGVTASFGLAQAQSVYRVVAPDGTVTFSDKPPATGTVVPVTKSSTSAANAASINNPTLPYELRQATAKYPVVLYSGSACPPCDTGRSLLNARGIPFSERIVTTREDADALKQLVGDSNNLPYLTIGSQKIKGFSELAWTQYLDVAGYPKKSALPSAYKNPIPSALVPPKKPTEALGQQPKVQEVVPMESTPTESPSPESNPDKPRGFVF